MTSALQFACGAAIVMAALSVDAQAQSSLMVAIPAGSYRPLYARAAQMRVSVTRFSMDKRAVTRGDYQTFVRAHAEWRRSRVVGVFADRNYLSGWASDTVAGSTQESVLPAIDISWFAASAFCATRNSRLPTVDEWEYVAAANDQKRDAARDRVFVQQLISVYMIRGHAEIGTVPTMPPNVYGIQGLHDAGWEWTQDFNSVLLSDDSRSSGSSVSETDPRAFCASAAIGSTDPTNYPAFLRYAMRAALTGRTTSGSLGFRCVSNS